MMRIKNMQTLVTISILTFIASIVIITLVVANFTLK